MPVDTAEKRRSAASVGCPVLIPGVTPNALKDTEWRQQAGWGYSGILASEPVTPIFLDPIRMAWVPPEAIGLTWTPPETIELTWDLHHD